MARKITTAMLSLELLNSREDATTKVQVQIDRGQKLWRMPIECEQHLNELESSYKRWVDFTKLMLAQLFSNSALSNDFGRYLPHRIMETDSLSLNDKANRIKKNVGKRIIVLESIKDRIVIIPISNSVEPQTTQEPRNLDISSGEVFIVHGHDEASKVSVARFLEKVGLKPII